VTNQEKYAGKDSYINDLKPEGREGEREVEGKVVYIIRGNKKNNTCFETSLAVLTRVSGKR
jgi:hypothetical protein